MLKFFPAVTKGGRFLSLYLAEFVGSFLFTFLQTLLTVTTADILNEAMSLDRVIVIALGGGFLYYGLLALSMTLSGGSGCYLHPGLTCSLVATDLFLKVPVYNEVRVGLISILLQISGATIGSIAAYYSLPDTDVGVEQMGIGQPNLGISDMQLWSLELGLSIFFAMVVLSARSNETRRSSILIGMAYTATTLLAFPLAFSTLNPARSLAPVVASGFTNGTAYVWIEVTAQMLGCILGSLVFYYLNYDTLRSRT